VAYEQFGPDRTAFCFVVQPPAGSHQLSNSGMLAPRGAKAAK